MIVTNIILVLWQFFSQAPHCPTLPLSDTAPLQQCDFRDASAKAKYMVYVKKYRQQKQEHVWCRNLQSGSVWSGESVDRVQKWPDCGMQITFLLVASEALNNPSTFVRKPEKHLKRRTNYHVIAKFE